MRFLLGALFALILSGPVFSGAAAAQPVNTGHIQAELVASAQGIGRASCRERVSKQV